MCVRTHTHTHIKLLCVPEVKMELQEKNFCDIPFWYGVDRQKHKHSWKQIVL